MRNGSERRKQARYVVVGIEAILDGEPSPIVDISRSAVRLLKPDGWSERNGVHELAFRVDGRRGCRIYQLQASVVRTTAVEVVLRYEAPTPRWEAQLRAHDTFLQTSILPL